MAPSLVSHSALLTSRAGGDGAFEIQETRELAPDARDVCLDLLGREELALNGLAARIADEPRAAPDEGDRRVTAALHVRKRSHDEQVSHMKARRGRIKADVAGDLPLRERLAHAVGRVVHESAPRQLAMEVHQPLL